MRKIALVTGGAGFVGSNLVEYLLDQNWSVLCYDNFLNGKKKFLPIDNVNLEILEGDIRDTVELKSIVNKFHPQVVFHLAALHFIPFCNSNPHETVLVNVAGTESVLEACEHSSVQKFIYASTAAVYGISEKANSESDFPNPMDIYGITKNCGEQLVHLFFEKTSVTSAVARLFNIYGPHETNPHIIPEILEQLTLGEKVYLGNLAPKRDYIYVGDVVKALMMIESNFNEGYGIFNVGTGKEYSVKELVEIIGGLLNENISIEVDENKVRQQERMHLIANIHKIKSIIGWESEESIETGLQKLINLEYSHLMRKTTNPEKEI